MNRDPETNKRPKGFKLRWHYLDICIIKEKLKSPWFLIIFDYNKITNKFYFVIIYQMKVIRKPLLDINWIDFWTWRVNKEAMQKQAKEFRLMEIQIISKSNKRFKEKVEDWKVYVEWLGECTI